MKPEHHEKGCKDIARQLIENEPGRSINVIMGVSTKGFFLNTS